MKSSETSDASMKPSDARLVRFRYQATWALHHRAAASAMSTQITTARSTTHPLSAASPRICAAGTTANNIAAYRAERWLEFSAGNLI